MTFPFTLPDAPEHAGPLPERVDVVVIGGGVIGVMTAWFLAERGMKVLLCEKGRIAAEQSSRNWGWVRQQGRHEAELPISVESLAIWKQLAAEFGPGLGFHQGGVTYIAGDERTLAHYEGWLKHARANGVDSRILSRAEMADLIPAYAGPVAGGLLTSSDARAEPWVAVPMFAAGAARRGVILRERCAVRCLDLAAGRIAGVVTEAGRVACDQVVVAAGAWSRLFLRNHGVKIPQLSVRSSVAITEPMPEIYGGNAVDGDFAFRRRMDGGYTITPAMAHDFFIGPDAFASLFKYLPVLRRDFSTTGLVPFVPKGFPDAWGQQRRWSGDTETPFERMRILNPRPNMRLLRKVQEDFARRLPSLGRPVLRKTWAGMIDTMPDVVPIVDRVPNISGLVLATGMSGHGFGIGPGMGRVIADLVLERPVGHDLTAFRFARFSDGSPIDFGEGL